MVVDFQGIYIFIGIYWIYPHQGCNRGKFKGSKVHPGGDWNSGWGGRSQINQRRFP